MFNDSNAFPPTYEQPASDPGNAPSPFASYEAEAEAFPSEPAFPQHELVTKPNPRT